MYPTIINITYSTTICYPRLNSAIVPLVESYDLIGFIRYWIKQSCTGTFKYILWSSKQTLTRKINKSYGLYFPLKILLHYTLFSISILFKEQNREGKKGNLNAERLKISCQCSNAPFNVGWAIWHRAQQVMPQQPNERYVRRNKQAKSIILFDIPSSLICDSYCSKYLWSKCRCNLARIIDDRDEK